MKIPQFKSMEEILDVVSVDTSIPVTEIPYIGRVKNSLNYQLFQKNPEINTQPSKTIPDQTMSLREIMTRYAHGLPIDKKIPLYDGEEGSGINPATLDLAERQEMAQEYAEELQAIKTRIAERKAKGEAKNDLKIDSGE